MIIIEKIKNITILRVFIIQSSDFNIIVTIYIPDIPILLKLLPINYG